MITLQVFDKPMCCSTGVCGPQVDPVLPRFAADLDWLSRQGVTVERFNLAQQPKAFVAHTDVKEALHEGYDQALPLVRVNDRIVSKGVYPSRQELAGWCGVAAPKALTMVDPVINCCGPTRGQ